MVNWKPLLGIILLAYTAFVVYVAVRKPPAIWDLPKIKLFRQALKETGTVILFLVFGAISLGFGIWLLIPGAA